MAYDATIERLEHKVLEDMSWELIRDLDSNFHTRTNPVVCPLNEKEIIVTGGLKN